MLIPRSLSLLPLWLIALPYLGRAAFGGTHGCHRTALPRRGSRRSTFRVRERCADLQDWRVGQTPDVSAGPLAVAGATSGRVITVTHGEKLATSLLVRQWTHRLPCLRPLAVASIQGSVITVKATYAKLRAMSGSDPPSDCSERG